MRLIRSDVDERGVSSQVGVYELGNLNDWGVGRWKRRRRGKAEEVKVFF